MNRNTLLLLAVFTLGCAAGMSLDSRAQAQSPQTPAPSAATAPPAAATPPAQQRQRWEQYCSRTTSVEELSEEVRKAGLKGWELVALSGGAACYKRPVM